jgi:hypothetical protein
MIVLIVVEPQTEPQEKNKEPHVVVSHTYSVSQLRCSFVAEIRTSLCS